MELHLKSESTIRKTAKTFLRNLKDDIDTINPKLSDWWLNYLLAQEERYLNNFKSLAQFPKNISILEIGSIPGHFHALLKYLGYKIIGVDIAPERIQPFIKKYSMKIEKIDIEKEILPFPEDSFDLILFNEVIEHLRLNPFKALREIFRVMKPEGTLFLSTPNITFLHRVNFFLHGKSFLGNPVKIFQKVENLGHIGHYRIYTLSELKEMLNHVGFKINSVFYRGRPNIHTLKDKLILKLSPKRRFKKKTLYILVSK